MRLAHSGDAPFIWSVRIGAGRQGFRFVDAGGVETATDARTNWSAAAGLGRYSPRLGYVAVEYRHDRRFFSRTAAGPPSGRTLDIASIEWRRFFPGGRVAINPSFSRDLRGNISSIDLPFYFLALSSGSLAGGARAGWRSDTRTVAVALFVGTAIRLTSP
jgi:hypothetical protein